MSLFLEILDVSQSHLNYTMVMNFDEKTDEIVE